jgi:DNA polymerase III alpha subunit (gram-positive type)
MKKEIYISTDIETDGPIPGPNSMLSFGSVALDEDGNELGSFTRNLDLLNGASGNEDTLKWWSLPKNKLAWEACRKDCIPAWQAMHEYVKWVEEISSTYNAAPVFVAYPAGFDFLFMYWYMMKFVGKSPFSFSAIDIKTYAMAMLGKGYRQSTKKNMPSHWFPKGVPHTHIALDDAREQGLLFIAMLKENNERFMQ